MCVCVYLNAGCDMESIVFYMLMFSYALLVNFTKKLCVSANSCEHRA